MSKERSLVGFYTKSVSYFGYSLIFFRPKFFAFELLIFLIGLGISHVSSKIDNPIAFTSYVWSKVDLLVLNIWICY